MRESPYRILLSVILFIMCYGWIARGIDYLIKDIKWLINLI